MNSKLKKLRRILDDIEYKQAIGVDVDDWTLTDLLGEYSEKVIDIVYESINSSGDNGIDRAWDLILQLSKEDL